MTAQNSNRTVITRDGKTIAMTTKAAATIYKGALVMNDGGYAIPATTTTGKQVLGYATTQAGSGAIVEIRSGVIQLHNSASSDQITAADIGNTAWVVDDQTVAKTNGSGARSPAGSIIGVDTDGVFVKVGF